MLIFATKNVNKLLVGPRILVLLCWNYNYRYDGPFDLFLPEPVVTEMESL